MFQRFLSFTLIASLATTGLAQDLPATASPTLQCSVAGKTWTEGFIYLTGQAGVYPSIYAECKNGAATCYRQTRVRDVARDPIECNESEIHALRRRLGIYAPQQDMRWPQGVVCYTYGNSNFSPQEREVFTKAMDEYHQKTNVKFILLDQCQAKYGDKTSVCGGCRHSFQFVNRQNACFATLGYVPGRESTLNFGQTCFAGGHPVAVHELGHITGMIHEHMHPQREVVILREEIRVGPDNFQKMQTSAITAYDRKSVMHYKRDNGACCIPKDRSRKYCDIMEQAGTNGCVVPTRNDCDPSQDSTFGHSPGLADSDVETLAKMYGSKSGETPSTSSPANTTSVPGDSSKAPTTFAPGGPSRIPPTSVPDEASRTPPTSVPGGAPRPPTTPRASVPLPPSTPSPLPTPRGNTGKDADGDEDQDATANTAGNSIRQSFRAQKRV